MCKMWYGGGVHDLSMDHTIHVCYRRLGMFCVVFVFFQAEDGIRDRDG